VVNAVTGEPVRKAQIQILLIDRRAGGANFTPYSAESDASGNFRVDSVQPGTYRIAATRTGFAGGARGEMGGGVSFAIDGGALSNRPVNVGPGQQVKDIVIRLTPAGVISGRVLDEDGDPVESASVQLQRFQYLNGKRQLLPARGGISNDLGEFRLSGIEPGRYVLAVNRRGAGGPAMYSSSNAPLNPQRPAEYEYIPIYYPAAIDPVSATPVVINPGTMMTGVDVRLQKARVFRVRGKVNGVTPMGDGPRGGFSAMVFLNPNTPSALVERRPSPVHADGTFEIRGVRPGSYTLVGQQGGREQHLSARAPVEVGDGDVTGVELFLLPGSRLTGRVVFEGDAKPDFTRFTVQFLPIEDIQVNSGHARIEAEGGTFETTPLEPARYRVSVQPVPNGYYLKSARWGDQEVLDSGLLITPGTTGDLKILLSPGAATISGSVRDNRDQPVPNAVVTLIPESRYTGWWDLYRYLRASESGEFKLTSIRPGTYKLYAWEQLENGAHQDSVFMRSFDTAGLAVTIQAGGAETVQLGVIPGSATQGR
jgi:protocatechuate 3,4-dioxygenase beta subunit